MGIEIGILAVRRSVLINAPPERVWREFESLEGIDAWFGFQWQEGGRRGHRVDEYDPRPGGSIKLSLETTDGGRRSFGGPIVVFEPGRELTFLDEDIPSPGPREPVYITIRLTPALGGTLVELFHHTAGTAEGAADEHLGHEMGWTAYHLAALKRIVED